MKAWKHQIEIAKEGIYIIKEKAMVYLAMEERTGKSLTAILMVEQLKVNTCLIITKKSALDGWNEILQYPTKKIYTLVNYHKVKDIVGKFDIIILDEAHNYISGFPKPPVLGKLIYKKTYKKPIIYLSATPCAQTPALLYHQFRLSTWTPWHNYATFYKWHKRYGIPYTQWKYKREVAMYDSVKDTEVWNCVKDIFIFRTRKELGFDQEPEDKLHYIELNEGTKYVYNTIANDKVYRFSCGLLLIADSITKVRYSLHMLEGGVAKIKDDYITLANNEKIDYIKKTWGDKPNLVIMYNFIQEGVKLREQFKNALILQGTKYAEGIDLHKYDTLVIYSQDYSTARHSQRRARQANRNRITPIIIHYLLVKDAISDKVYTTVSINKKNYIDKLYKHHTL